MEIPIIVASWVLVLCALVVLEGALPLEQGGTSAVGRPEREKRATVTPSATGDLISATMVAGTMAGLSPAMTSGGNT